MQPLYQTALGTDFDALPPLLQRFHSRIGEAWQGEAAIRWSNRAWLRLLLWLGGLPPEGEAVPVSVMLSAHRGRERWLRRFAGRAMASHQFMVGEQLREGYGPMSLLLESKVDGEGVLRQRSLACRWLGLPMPKPLAAEAVASERQVDGRLCFDVAVSIWGFDFIHYQGWLKPVNDHAHR